MPSDLTYLLLQIRNADDPMLPQEQATFLAALACEPACLLVWDLLQGEPPGELLEQCDIVLIGGSGHYSAAGSGPWLDRALAALQNLYESKQPTFASCWGFHALARALGGRTITDLDYAEVGSRRVQLTAAGQADPIFGPAGESFLAFQGHQDRVVTLPPGAVHLASSELVALQAFTFPDRPIYATQFHPELTRARFLERLETYPEYIEMVTGQTYDEFAAGCVEATASRGLLTRFVQMIRKQRS